MVSKSSFAATVAARMSVEVVHIDWPAVTVRISMRDERGEVLACWQMETLNIGERLEVSPVWLVFLPKGVDAGNIELVLDPDLVEQHKERGNVRRTWPAGDTPIEEGEPMDSEES